MLDTALQFLVDAKRRIQFEEGAPPTCDLFISAYNDSERVKYVFSQMPARRKVWWLLPEYAYEPHEYPNWPNTVVCTEQNESDLIANGLESSGYNSGNQCRICIDITGFMMPHILFFLRFFKSLGVDELDFIYTEPEHYVMKAETRFSLDDISVVRPVAGFEGQHTTDMANDLLIVGVGYDHNPIGRVIQNKESARLVQFHCFPSLSADMYHESVLRMDRVSSVPGKTSHDQFFFSSANDPYLTAAALTDAFRSLASSNNLDNIYLSPLATKPQAVGFGLFYLRLLEGAPASIIYPFSCSYSRGTSTGVGRSWMYPIVF